MLVLIAVVVVLSLVLYSKITIMKSRSGGKSTIYFYSYYPYITA